MFEEYETVLVDMVNVAREAGALTLSHFERFRELEIDVKGPADFVSKADRQSEQLIRKLLTDKYPDWGFVGEEFPPIVGTDPEHYWLVDPIDGTTNFLNGQHYTISIALRHKNTTVCGALYNPVSDEMFSAIKGDGAFLNGKRLHVSERTDVGLMAVGTGLPTRNYATFPGFYDRLETIREPIGTLQTVGSSANACAYVACGRLTGYFEEAALIDWAVGVLLVEEAGGTVTDWSGRGPGFYERSGCVIVANPSTHAYLLAKLRDAPSGC